MISIIGTVLPIPVTVTVTAASLLMWTLLNSLAIPTPYHIVGNVVMITAPMIALLFSVYIYAASVMASPIISAMYNGSEDIDPSIIMREACTRSIVVTFYVECWSRNDGDKVITFTSTHTHELYHDTTIGDMPDVGDAKIIRLKIIPKVELMEGTKEMLDGMQQNLYDHYKDRGVHCSVKYKVDIPGLPMTLTLVSGIKYSTTVTMLVISSIILTPIYLLVYWMKTKFIQYEVVKHVAPTIKEGYPSAPQ